MRAHQNPAPSPAASPTPARRRSPKKKKKPQPWHQHPWIRSGKYLSLPALALVVTFVVACGNKDSASPNLSQTASAAIASGAADMADEAPEPVTLAQWCTDAGGFYHEAQKLCEVQMKRLYGRNYNVLWEKWWPTGMQVLPNDTVSVTVSGRPKMRLGSELRESVTSGTYVATSAGGVDFTSRSMTAGFELREVSLKRCYDGKGSTARCPK